DALADQVEVRALARAEDDGRVPGALAQLEGQLARAAEQLAAERGDAAAVGGEHEPLAPALVERDAERLAELLHLGVQGRLGEAQRAGGPGEALVIRERDEGLEPLE